MTLEGLPRESLEEVASKILRSARLVAAKAGVSLNHCADADIERTQSSPSMSSAEHVEVSRHRARKDQVDAEPPNSAAEQRTQEGV